MFFQNIKMYSRPVIIAFMLLLLRGGVNAQTTLALGDIAFTGINTSTGTSLDEFSFVILKSTGITSNTTIFFTDRNWKGGSCGADNFCSTSDTSIYTESTSQFTWTAGSSLSFGTHVKIAGAGSTTTFSCSNGSASGNVLQLPTSGEQIFALQSSTSGTMLAAIHTNKSGLSGCSFSYASWDNCSSNINFNVCGNSNQSNKPSCLTTGTNCLVMLTSGDAEVANGVYNCTSASSNTSGAAITAMRTAINNKNNWTTSSSTVTIPPSGCNPLPVNWVYFNASRTGFGVNLEWGTASEYNCSHFEVERSFDLVDWKTLQHVTGGGTKSNPTTYNYDDMEVRDENRIIYYRIRQVDNDGKFEYTGIQAAGASLQQGYTAFNFNGNPFSEQTYLKTFLPNEGDASIQIIDASGHPAFDRVYHYQGGYNRFNLLDEAPGVMSKAGFYFIRASIDGETKTFKLLVR